MPITATTANALPVDLEKAVMPIPSRAGSADPFRRSSERTLVNKIYISTLVVSAVFASLEHLRKYESVHSTNQLC